MSPTCFAVKSRVVNILERFVCLLSLAAQNHLKYEYESQQLCVKQ